MKRKIVLMCLIITSYLLQCTVFQRFSMGGIVPNIMLILTSAFGFMRGKKEGLFVGFFCGLLIDIFYSDIIGLYSLIYLVIGYLNGYFHRIFYPEDVKLPIIFIGVSDFTYCMISYVLLFLLRTRMGFLSYVKNIILPELIYTVLVTIIFYRFILWVNRKLEESEKKSAAKFT